MSNNFMFFLSLISSTMLASCQSKQEAPTTIISTSPIAENLKRLTGIWIRQDTMGPYKGGFQVVRINADSTGTFTFFYDDSKVIGRAFYKQHPGLPPYFLMDGPLKVRYRPQISSVQRKSVEGYVQIWTSRFRFDYALSGDTLREYDKTGFQGSLVRMKPAE